MLEILFATANAQEAAATGAQANPIMNFMPFIFIFFIFYFLMIRPQKKKAEQEQLMLNTIGKGDEIFTKSGILGTIIGMTEKIVTLESDDGSKLKILRSHIGGKAASLFEKKEDNTKKK